MKVLFAIGNDQLSKNIAERYYEKYGEVLEYKNVFIFKSLLDEVKKNKTYDRIIIKEELEEYRTRDTEQLDRVIFDYIDRITDETQDAEIILVCANRRTKGDPFLNKLFSIGIYNLLIGEDRNINPLCEAIKKPKNKREAKQYLNIDTSLITEDSITKDNEVDERQVKSILNYYEGIINEPEKFVSTFDRITEQYSRAQLMIIFEYLQKEVKREILKVDRYKYLLSTAEDKVQKAQTTQQTTETKNVEQPKKKGGLFGFMNKHKDNPKQNVGSIDMSQLQASGVVDLSSNKEEQKIENLQAEARQTVADNKAKEQAMLAEKAKAEAIAREQAMLAEKARAEAEARAAEEEKKKQLELEAKARAELEAKARAEAAAREQAMLAEKAKAEAAAREQAMLAEKAKAEAAAREQAMLAEKAKAEAAAREQAILAEKAKTEAAAREQAMLAERAKAEAAAREHAENAAKSREQAMLEAKAKAEVMAKEQAILKEQAKANAIAMEKAKEEAKLKAGSTKTTNGVVQVSAEGGVDVSALKGNNLIEIKPNPNAPERNNQRKEIPVAEPIKAPVQPEKPVVEPPKAPAQPVVEPPKASAQPVKPIVEPPKPPVQPVVEPPKTPVQPEIKINISTNSGIAPNHAQTTKTVYSTPQGTETQTSQTSINSRESNVVSSALSEQEKRMKEEQEKLALEQKKIREAQEKLEEEKRKLREEQEKFVNAQNQMKNEQNNVSTQYTNSEVPMRVQPTGVSQKMIVIVGANKVGTTFVTNAIAHTMASSKVVTSIIDMTRDKSMYYIYADESKTLKNRAAECMQRLADGEDYYIETTNSNLKVYASVAGSIADQRRGYKHKAIIETVKRNCDLTIVDADFTTPIDYFDQADEIYLVQDLDILKIQDVTLFLREINARGLDKKKIRLIINKYVKTSITPKIIIGALDFYHDPAGTYVNSGLMPSKVDYTLLPYNLNNYAKYVESLHKMSGSFNYKSYSTDFVEAINEICGKIYSKSNAPKGRRFFG